MTGHEGPISITLPYLPPMTLDWIRGREIFLIDAHKLEQTIESYLGQQSMLFVEYCSMQVSKEHWK